MKKKLIFPDFISYPGSQTPRGYRTLEAHAACFEHDIFYDVLRGVWTTVPEPYIVSELIASVATSGYPEPLVMRHEQNFHNAIPEGFQAHVVPISKLQPEDLIFDASPARKYWLRAIDGIFNFDQFVKNHMSDNYTLPVLRPRDLAWLVPEEELSEPAPQVIPKAYGEW